MGNVHLNPMRALSPLSDALPNKAAIAFTPPVLDPPSPEWRLLQKIEPNMRALKNKTIALEEKELSGYQQELKELNEQKIEKLKESAANVQKSDFWSILQHIASYVTAALSIITGIFLAPVNPLLSACVIGGGIASIANVMIQDLGGWEWLAKKLTSDPEKQRSIQNTIPALISGLILGLNYISGANLWTAFDTEQKILSFINAISLLVGGTSSAVRGIYDAKIEWTDADLNKLKSEIDLLQKRVDKSNLTTEQDLRALKNPQSQVGQIMSIHGQNLELFSRR